MKEIDSHMYHVRKKHLIGNELISFIPAEETGSCDVKESIAGELVNIFDKKRDAILKKIDQVQYLNGELPMGLRELIMKFIPLTTYTEKIPYEWLQIIPKNQRKHLIQQGNYTTVEKVSYTKALHYIRKQISTELAQGISHIDKRAVAEGKKDIHIPNPVYTQYIEKPLLDTHKKKIDNQYDSPSIESIQAYICNDILVDINTIVKLYETGSLSKDALRLENLRLYKKIRALYIKVINVGSRGERRIKVIIANKYLLRYIQEPSSKICTFMGYDSNFHSILAGIQSEAFGDYFFTQFLHKQNSGFVVADLPIDPDVHLLLDQSYMTDTIYFVQAPDMQRYIYCIDYKALKNHPDGRSIHTNFSNGSIDSPRNRYKKFVAGIYTHTGLPDTVVIRGIDICMGIASLLYQKDFPTLLQARYKYLYEHFMKSQFPIHKDIYSQNTSLPTDRYRKKK